MLYNELNQKLPVILQLQDGVIPFKCLVLLSTAQQGNLPAYSLHCHFNAEGQAGKLLITVNNKCK